MHFYRKCWFDPFEEQFISPFLSDCPSLMLGIAIHCIQHSQAMLERGVCELAHSFFHWPKMAKFSSWHKINRSRYRFCPVNSSYSFQVGNFRGFLFYFGHIGCSYYLDFKFWGFFLKKITRLVHHLSTCLFTIVQKITVWFWFLIMRRSRQDLVE